MINNYCSHILKVRIILIIRTHEYTYTYSHLITFEMVQNFAGGLSMNDFIVAAKIDQIKTSDLVPRKRVWA